MPKPLTAGERKKVDQIANEITHATKQSGKGIAVNQTPTFQDITAKGAKIRIARAFAKSVNSGEIKGMKVAGRTKANHVLYSTSSGAGGGPRAEKKGILARLFGG